MTEPLNPDPSSETTLTPTPAVPPATPSPDAAAAASAPVATPPQDAIAPAVTPPAVPVTDTTPPVATAPVSPDGSTAAAPRKRSRLRWAAAAGVIAVVVLVSAAAAFVLTAGASTAAILGYVPADSVAYGELRLDLPGDQKQAVGEFLSKFPGFKDQAALDTKLDEVLDRLVASASSDKQTFTKDIKPWFDGEIGFAVGPLPATTQLTDPSKAAADSRALLLLSVKDAALAQSWFDGVLSESGTTSTTQTYDGVQLTVASEPSMPGTQGAFGIIDGKVAVVGDLDSVQAAIDTDGSSGLAGDPAFSAASDAVDGDHLGFFYVHLRSILDRVMAAAPTTDGPALTSEMLALVPEWMAAGFRVENDALVLDSIAPHNAAAPGPDANHANGVADWAPPTTVLMAAANDYGATLRETIDLYRKDPSLKDAFAGVDQAAGILGGLDPALAWIGDAGIVVNQDGTAIEGGLVAIPTDSAGATQLFTTLRSFATLGGATAGVSVRDIPYGDATITVIDLGAPKDLIGMAGVLSGGQLPTDPSTLPLPSGDIELSYAVTDKVVVIGSGPDFVKSVLDAGAGASLADEARFASLLGRVGKEHTGVTFVDVAAIRGLVEGMMASVPGADHAEYTESIQPFLEPFDAVIAANSVGTDVDTSRFIVTVK